MLRQVVSSGVLFFVALSLAMGSLPPAAWAAAEPAQDKPSAAAPEAKTKEAENKKSANKPYDEEADGAKQIEAALATAEKENKRVLLQFGANWCGWCHKLHKLFHDNDEVRKKLDASYVVVLIDVNGEHNQEINAKYGKPTKHGLPAIVVLDAEGKQLTTQDTGKLEEGDHHDPQKVLAFLAQWEPKK